MLKISQVPINPFATSGQETVDNKDNKDEPPLGFMSHESRKPNITPSPPASPVPTDCLHKETNRLATFSHWAVPFIDKKLLARTGFYFIGPNDLVKCFFCLVEIGCWEPDDSPVEEHLRWSPSCRLMRGRETSNEPLDAEALKRILPEISYDTCGIRDVHPAAYAESSQRSASPPQSSSPQPSSSTAAQPATSVAEALMEMETTMRRPEHPEFQIENNRLATYEDWPKTMKQKPLELAEAGFYYTGKGDRVICFSCGGGLKHWEESDAPWEQHAMWYSKCEYLKLMKGQPYIDEILARKNSPPSSFSEDSLPQAGTAEPCRAPCPDPPKSVSDNRLCKICFECEYNTAFIPCGHIACAKCATSVTKCPFCRKPFAKIMRVYLT